MIKPSSLVDAGIVLRPTRGLTLFKFSPELQTRLDELNAKRKASTLSSAEQTELAGILELDQIFTLLNAKLIAQSHD